MLRQGTWYPVVNIGSNFVMLDVRERYVMVPKHLVEVRPTRPERFTVVYRANQDPNPVRGSRGDLGRRYAVCPGCSTRLRLFGEPEAIHCFHCGHEGDVAWWETG
jgi:hypothetical protein